VNLFARGEIVRFLLTSILSSFSMNEIVVGECVGLIERRMFFVKEPEKEPDFIKDGSCSDAGGWEQRKSVSSRAETNMIFAKSRIQQI
jgi:hypothetical protein